MSKHQRLSARLFLLISSGIALITAVASSSSSSTTPLEQREQCIPTPSVPSGPMYSTHRPFAKDGVICSAATATNDTGGGGVTLMASSMLAWQRTAVAGPSSITVRGRIRSSDDCKEIPHAVIDVWQTDSLGIYRKLNDPDIQEGQCRGWLRSNVDGSFAFQTQIPGSYGLQLGGYGPIGGFDFAPWGPRHIHVAVAAPGHKLLTTEIQFQDDPNTATDWRELLAGQRMNTVVARLGEKGEIGVDLVLEPASTKEEVALSLEPIAVQLHAQECKGPFDIPQPHHLCRPEVFAAWLDVNFAIATTFLMVAAAIMTAIAFAFWSVANKLFTRLSRK